MTPKKILLIATAVLNAGLAILATLDGGVVIATLNAAMSLVCAYISGTEK